MHAASNSSDVSGMARPGALAPLSEIMPVFRRAGVLHEPLTAARGAVRFYQGFSSCRFLGLIIALTAATQLAHFPARRIVANGGSGLVAGAGSEPATPGLIISPGRPFP
jgi:hypothetical protein